MKKFLKWLFIIFIIIPVVFLAGIWLSYTFYIDWEMHKQSHNKIVDNEYCWGMGCRTQEKNLEEFFPILSGQMKVMAPAVKKIWPWADFSKIKAYFINKQKTKSWIVWWDWKIEDYSASKFLEKYPVMWYDLEFGFDEKEPQSMYLVVSDDEMRKQEGLESYPYLWTYDPALTVIHEGFHYFIQDASFNKGTDEVSRIEVLTNQRARTQRTWIIELFKKALITQDKEKKEQFLKQAKYFFEIYKKENPKEFIITRYFDTIEWTAAYVETLSALSWKNKGNFDREQLNKMLISMYSKVDYFDFAVWAVNEWYTIWSLAGYILDQLEENPDDWKKKIQNNPKTSPVIYLLSKYEIEKSEIPETFKEKVKKEIKKKSGYSWKPVIKFIYDITF